MKSVLVIIPAYNEEASIERVVNELTTCCHKVDYIIVNDGSTDATKEICQKKGFRYLNLPFNLGLSGAVQAGILYAYNCGYEAALQFDGDGQHDPTYIDAMYQCMKEHNVDIVIGSRFIEKKKPGSLRMLGSRLIALAIRLTTKKRIVDPTSGMRLYGRKVLREFAQNMNYDPEPDTISFLMNNDVVVREIQVEMREREAGQSYLTIGRSIMYMLNVIISIILLQRFRKRI